MYARIVASVCNSPRQNMRAADARESYFRNLLLPLVMKIDSLQLFDKTVDKYPLIHHHSDFSDSSFAETRPDGMIATRQNEESVKTGSIEITSRNSELFSCAHSLVCFVITEGIWRNVNFSRPKNAYS